MAVARARCHWARPLTQPPAWTMAVARARCHWARPLTQPPAWTMAASPVASRFPSRESPVRTWTWTMAQDVSTLMTTRHLQPSSSSAGRSVSLPGRVAGTVWRRWRHCPAGCLGARKTADAAAPGYTEPPAGRQPAFLWMHLSFSCPWQRRGPPSWCRNRSRGQSPRSRQTWAAVAVTLAFAFDPSMTSSAPGLPGRVRPGAESPTTGRTAPVRQGCDVTCRPISTPTPSLGEPRHTQHHHVQGRGRRQMGRWGDGDCKNICLGAFTLRDLEGPSSTSTLTRPHFLLRAFWCSLVESNILCRLLLVPFSASVHDRRLVSGRSVRNWSHFIPWMPTLTSTYRIERAKRSG